MDLRCRSAKEIHERNIIVSNCTRDLSGALERAKVIDHQWETPQGLMEAVRGSRLEHHEYNLPKGGGGISRPSDFKSFDPKTDAKSPEPPKIDPKQEDQDRFLGRGPGIDGPYLEPH